MRECSGQSEIGEFENSCFGDKNVSSLHVAMKNLVAMNVEEAVEKLLHHPFDLA